MCGLSKSGKTSTIEACDLASTGFIHVRASTLLKDDGRPIASLRASDVFLNQEALVRTLTDAPYRGRDILLDGHLLIETADGPQLVPDSCLEPLPLGVVILFQAQAEQVAQRRAGTASAILPEEARRLMALEAVQAERVALRRRVPFLCAGPGDAQLLKNTLTQLRQAAGSH